MRTLRLVFLTKKVSKKVKAWHSTFLVPRIFLPSQTCDPEGDLLGAGALPSELPSGCPAVCFAQKKRWMQGRDLKQASFCRRDFLIVLRGGSSFCFFAFCDGGVMVNCFSKWLFKGYGVMHPFNPALTFYSFSFCFSAVFVRTLRLVTHNVFIFQRYSWERYA